ncbi:MAG: flavin reductase family protein [Myxococcales bacterium]
MTSPTRDATLLRVDASRAALAPASLDLRAFRSALSGFATGVTVVTALGHDGLPVGLTVSSFNSVSLEPPLVLWSLSANSPNLAVLAAATHFAVNVLAADQEDVSHRFASRLEDKFDGVVWQSGLGGAPVLAGTCASFECANVARYPGGDHLIFIGQVERFAQDDRRAPLIFQGGRYRRLLR